VEGVPQFLDQKFILKKNPNERPSFEEILDHSWLQIRHD
jgi:hypothetical protein